MKFGVEAGKYTRELAKELGVRGVPVAAAELVEKGPEAIVADLEKDGLQVCQIGEFMFNPLVEDDADFAARKQTVEGAIPLAGATGCPYIVINGGNYNPNAFGGTDKRNFTGAALDRVAERLKPTLELAESHGVYLTIEAYLKGAVGTPEAFLALRQRVDSSALRCSIDPTSLYDFRQMVDPDPFLEKVCSLLAGHYGIVHIKELGLSDGIHIHAGLLPLWEGSTDWKQFLKLIAPHLPDDSWVVYEHISEPEEGRKGVAILRQFADELGLLLK